MKSFAKFGILTAFARAVSLLSILYYAKISGPALFSEFTLYLIAVTAINNIVTSGVTPSIVRQLFKACNRYEELNCLANYFATMLFTLLLAILAHQTASYFLSNPEIFLNITFILQTLTLSMLIIVRVLIEASCHHYNQQHFLPISKLAEAAALSIVILVKPDASPFIILFTSYSGYLVMSVFLLVGNNAKFNLEIKPQLSVRAIISNIREISVLSCSAFISAATIPNLLQVQAGDYDQSVATFGLANQIHSIAIFIPATLNSFLLKKIMNKDTDDKKMIALQLLLSFAIPASFLIPAFLLRHPIQNFYGQYENINISIYLLIIAAIFHANSNTLNSYLLRENRAKVILLAGVAFSVTAFTAFYSLRDLTILTVEYSVLVAFFTSFVVKMIMVFSINNGIRK